MNFNFFAFGGYLGYSKMLKNLFYFKKKKS